MSARVDAWIARAAADASEADFATRVAESQRRVFQIACGVLGDPADAEEIAQETFLRAHRRFASLRDPARFQAWVSRIAFRLALNRRRARQRQRTRETAWQATRPAVAENTTDPLFLQRLQSEINRLPDKLRLVLVLSAVEGMEAREVATLLRIPAGTVRSRFYSARKRLLEVMKP
jgi:RNA polymerase sigma-70 factor (ECF subfamily)